mmetsp:Transcript_51918/g.110958  ORF Transcript_51918/g.110958 Transcript_51918/m.110958 type:complete len:404 (-) Transcript_51918:84-1295(-)
MSCMLSFSTPASELSLSLLQMLPQPSSRTLFLGDASVDAHRPLDSYVIEVLPFAFVQTIPRGGKGTEWYWLVGVLVTLLGATLTAAGLLVQKRSHLAAASWTGAAGRLVEGPLPGRKEPQRPYWQQGEWLLGGLLWLLGNAVCWLAAGLAPQSLLACLDCWNVVVTLAVGSLVFGERLSRGLVLSTAFLLVSCCWVLTAGPKGYREETVDLIYESCFSRQTACIVGVSAGFLTGLAARAYRWREVSPAKSFSCLELTAVSGILAWYTSVLSRSLAALIVTSIRHHNSEYQHTLFWLLLAAFLTCALLQIHFLNLGLRHGDAVVVLPTYMAMSMTGQIIAGGVFFNEFRHMDSAAHARFWPGVACVVLGITGLAWEQQSSFSPAIGQACKPEERAPLPEADDAG